LLQIPVRAVALLAQLRLEALKSLGVLFCFDAVFLRVVFDLAGATGSAASVMAPVIGLTMFV